MVIEDENWYGNADRFTAAESRQEILNEPDYLEYLRERIVASTKQPGR